MGNIINMKDKYRESIERKASEMFRAVKIDEDSYMIPSNEANSKKVDDSFLDSELYADKELRNKISKLEFKDNEYISITCKKIKRNNVKVLELVRVSEVIDEDAIIEMEVKSDLLYEERDFLLNMIADRHRDKQIFLTFYVVYNFNLLEGLVSET